jgi:hypothetical protein
VPLKVFLLEPTQIFVSVPPSGPSPQTGEDFVIRARKRAFTHNVPMIISPTSYFGVEFFDQIGGRETQRGLDCSSDAIQEGFNILPGRLDEQFSIRIPAHVLSEKIKAFLHVRNDCLCRRKFKPSFLQELLDEGLDLTFQ